MDKRSASQVLRNCGQSKTESAAKCHVFFWSSSTIADNVAHGEQVEEVGAEVRIGRWGQDSIKEEGDVQCLSSSSDGLADVRTKVKKTEP